MLILSLNELHIESSEGEKAFWLQVFFKLNVFKIGGYFHFQCTTLCSNTSQEIIHKEAKDRGGAFINHTKLRLHVSPYIFHRGGTLHLNRECSYDSLRAHLLKGNSPENQPKSTTQFH